MSSSYPSTIQIADTDVQWQWRDSYSWREYDPTQVVKLENAYQRNQKGRCEVTIYSDIYTVNFSNMTQTNSRTKYSREVKRLVRELNKRKVNVKELNNLFKKYKVMDEADEDAESYYRDDDSEGIGGEGIMAFCEDHNIDPQSIDLLYLFFKLGCHRKYFLNYDEFVHGLAKLGMETSSKIKKGVPKLKKELTSSNTFRDFYRWTYTYLLDPNQKTVPKELSVATWPLLMKDKYAHFDEWMEFIENEHPHAPSKDLWFQFYDFSNDTSFESFEDYDLEMSAYNTAIDEFVEWMKAKKSK